MSSLWLPRTTDQATARRFRWTRAFSVGLVLCLGLAGAALARPSTVSLYVATSGALDGDGSIANPYRRITDAIERARADRERGIILPEQTIQIRVAPGTYVGSYDPAALESHPEYEVLPIILNVSGLSVLGSTSLVRDARGLPTGSNAESETLLRADGLLRTDQSLFLIANTTDSGPGSARSSRRSNRCHPRNEARRAPSERPAARVHTRKRCGSQGNDVTVDGFVLDGKGGPFSQAFPHFPLMVDRVSGFRISNNVVRHGNFGILTRLASGTIEGNLLRDNEEAGGGISGGSLAQPSTVLVQANRITANGQHGIMALAVANDLSPDPGTNPLRLDPPLQATFDRDDPRDLRNIPDTLAITLSDNDFSAYGVFGIRFFSVIPRGNIPDCSPGIGYGTLDATQPLTAVLTAHVTGNTFAGTGFAGVGMEAGFPCRDDPRALVETFTGTFEGNAFPRRRRALFTFAAWGVTLGLDTPERFKLAEGSTYQVTDVDGELASFCYHHPPTDPIGGVPLDNTLVVNGVELPHGGDVGVPICTQ